MNEVVRLNPDDARYRMERAQLRFNAGDLDGSIADLERVLDLTSEEEFVIAAKLMLSQLR